MHTFDEEQGETRQVASFYDDKGTYLTRSSIAMPGLYNSRTHVPFFLFLCAAYGIIGYDLNGRGSDRGACD
jgi:hypothetical protein